MSRRLSHAIVDCLCGMCHRLTRLCTCDNSSTDGSQHGGVQLGAVAPVPVPVPDTAAETTPAIAAETAPASAVDIAPPIAIETAPAIAAETAPAPASTPSLHDPETDTKDAWKQTDQYLQTYGRIQADGAQCRTWMLDATAANCPIQACTLKYEDMLALYPVKLAPSHKDPHEDFEDQILELGLPDPASNTAEPSASAWGSVPQSPYWRFRINSSALDWTGNTGQGAIFITMMYRRDKMMIPYVSDIANAFYTRDFDIGSLRHIFFHDVVEQQTSEFADDVLYTLGESLMAENHRVDWTHGANPAEVEALLGTNVGKVASALVLGAFPRGTRVVNRVVVWYTQVGSPQTLVRMNMHMRFDIEDVAS